MKHWRSMRRTRVYSALVSAWKFAYAHPWMLLLLPIAVFFPLLNSRGLFELGDANFPLNPFRIDYILPWSAAGFGGADNTFVGVPRLIYHLSINLLIVTTHNLQVSQWVWYSSMAALGLTGAFLLARRLGAGIYSVPLAIVYALNIWSYDRIAQGPIFLSYQATPLAVYFFLRYLARPSVARALYFGCSVLVLIPSLQVCYLAVVICLGIAIYDVAMRGWRSIVRLAGLGAAVVAVNAFYVFSMIADALLNSGGNITLVNSRFNFGVFQHYAGRITIPNTLALSSFYYSSIDHQWRIVAIAAMLLPILLLALLLLARRPTFRSKFYAGLALALLGIWLVDGIVIAPGFYEWFHDTIPGLHAFVEPDYFSPLYIFGAFVMLCSWARLGALAYPSLWKPAIWFVAISGVVPFLPINGPDSGLPQTGQPRQYAQFSRAHVPGNTLWLPPYRGVKYRWSSYVINGFTSLNSPSDAIGPSMSESVSYGTDLVQLRLANAFVAGQLNTVESLAPLMGIGTVAISGDSENEFNLWPNFDVIGSLDTLRRLERSGFLRARSDETDVGVHLVTATTKWFLPEVGVYDYPRWGGDFEAFSWWSVVHHSAADYRPLYISMPNGPSTTQAMTKAQLPQVKERFLKPSMLDGVSDCGNGSKVHPIDAHQQIVTVSTNWYPSCFVLKLPKLHQFRAIQAVPDASPPGVLQTLLVLKGKLRDDLPIDTTFAPVELPRWPSSATILVKVPPYSDIVFKGLNFQSLPARDLTEAPLVHTCDASDLAWSKQNPLLYTVSGTLHGRCTVVFRESFSPIWALSMVSGGARILDHTQIDGFANAWIVDGSGPVTFRVVNRALYPYLWGMAITILSILVAAACGINGLAARRVGRSKAVLMPTEGA